MTGKNKAYVVLFLLLLVMPAIFANFSKDAISSIDNRKLTEYKFESLEKVSANVDSFAKDRVGFREAMINGYSILNNQLFDVMVHPYYSYGKDGYVFFKQKRYVDQRPYLDLFVKFVKDAQDYCESRGVPFIYVLNPNKESVYTEHLMDGYDYIESNTNYLVEQLNKTGVNFLNNIPLMRAKHLEEQVYNVKYDAGHWNDLGCYYASEALLNRVKGYFPDLFVPSKDDFQMTTTLKTSLIGPTFPINEYVPIFKVKTPKSVVDSVYANDIQIDKKHPSFFHSTIPNSTAPSALMFRGSYYITREHFINESFSEFTGVHNYLNIFNLPYYFNIFQPDIVIFSSTEYATNNSFFPEELLKNYVFPELLGNHSESIVNQGLRSESGYIPISGTYRYSQEKSLVNITLENKSTQKIVAANITIKGKTYDAIFGAVDDKEIISVTAKSSEFGETELPVSVQVTLLYDTNETYQTELELQFQSE